MGKPSVHDITVNNIKGQPLPLSKYKGKVLMVVNIASQCGFTPQLGDLEDLYKQYKDRGLEILGVPSNDFKNQEPREGEEITEFCSVNYGVTFDILEKSHVKGMLASPLFQFLGQKQANGKFNSTPKWNFHKYLLDKDGHAVDYFYTLTKPTSGKVKRAIEKLL